MDKTLYRTIQLLAQGKWMGNSLLFQHSFLLSFRSAFDFLHILFLSVFAKKSQFYLQ